MAYAGEMAALTTSLCWAFNSICFTLAGRRVGSQTVNAARLFMALGVLLLVHKVAFGTFFPWHAGTLRLTTLGLSGLIGFALGDALLFEAFLLLGARVAMLLMTLSPVFSVILARIFLGQSLSFAKILAILVTLAGIAWVVGEGTTGGTQERPKHWVLGVTLGVGGALGQAVGLILSGKGLAGGFNPISANLIRVVAGTVALTIWLVLRWQFLETARALKDGKATIYIAAGAITGPVIGVGFSLYAIAHTSMGVAATLMSLSPVILLPIGVGLFREHVSPRAWAGTVLSIAGAAALFWV
jgi:drug/metabolite transporter (DMT)-like permease